MSLIMEYRTGNYRSPLKGEACLNVMELFLSKKNQSDFSNSSHKSETCILESIEPFTPTSAQFSIPGVSGPYPSFLQGLDSGLFEKDARPREIDV